MKLPFSWSIIDDLSYNCKITLHFDWHYSTISYKWFHLLTQKRVLISANTNIARASNSGVSVGCFKEKRASGRKEYRVKDAKEKTKKKQKKGANRIERVRLQRLKRGEARVRHAPRIHTWGQLASERRPFYDGPTTNVQLLTNYDREIGGVFRKYGNES